MAATIRQDPYGQGKKCVELALTLLEGKEIQYADAKTRSIFFRWKWSKAPILPSI